jgi:hypothetical protein
MMFVGATMNQKERARKLILDVSGMDTQEAEHAILVTRCRKARIDINNKGFTEGSYIALKSHDQILKVGMIAKLRTCEEIEAQLSQNSDATFLVKVVWKYNNINRAWTQPFNLQKITEEDSIFVPNKYNLILFY